MPEHAPRVRALLTDLDGVIRDWSGQDDARIERESGLPEGSIKAAAFAPELVLPAITGDVTDEEWRRQATARLCERYPAADVERAMAAWSEPAGEVVPEVMALVQATRERVPVALITNATSRLDADLQRLGILDAFDHIVNSSAVGAAKPDRAIFEHALETVGAAAAETFYMDDQQRYLDAAAEIGIVTHHYRCPDGLRAALTRHGLP
jgi:putative hydrolase of the HAD superfamily